MSALYEDGLLRCDEDGLTLRYYMFPFGWPKFLKWREIKSFEERPARFWNARLRIWGMNLPAVWFPADLRRPVKRKWILLDTGKFMKIGITPENHEAVCAILADHVGRGRTK